MGRINKPTRRTLFSGPRVNPLRQALATHIGSRLLALRQAEGVTMRELGQKTGLSSAFVCQIENGQSMPTAETLWLLARAFDVPAAYFFECFTDPPADK